MEVMKVGPWSDRTGAFVRRGRDTSELSLPCEDTERSQPFTNQQECPHQTPNLMAPRSHHRAGAMQALRVCYHIYFHRSPFRTHSTCRSEVSKASSQVLREAGRGLVGQNFLVRYTPWRYPGCCSWKHAHQHQRWRGDCSFSSLSVRWRGRHQKHKGANQGYARFSTKLFIQSNYSSRNTFIKKKIKKMYSLYSFLPLSYKHCKHYKRTPQLSYGLKVRISTCEINKIKNQITAF